jgi:two-component system nitrogen regulation response regulator NtrX
MAGERILVVDDEPGVRSLVRSILVDEGYGVVCAADAETGLEEVGRGRFDAILLDVWLPGMDGLEALRLIKERRSDAEVVMISGHGNIETAVRATKLGAFDFVEKPLSLEKTLVVLRNALRQRRLEARNRQLLQQLARETEIVGGSAAAERLRSEVEVAAASTASVLIRGEPGSGRESVARRIHAGGRQADGPFVAVPCGALDGAAAAEALFGRGGAAGRIELAAGGSLFLEAPDRLDPALQGQLASALELPGESGDPVRVLASVDSAAGDLVPALRQQLEVLCIEVPALRRRREDIPLLAERFMTNLAREYGKPPKRLSAECLLALKAHDWPGNLRGLRNVVERLLLFAPGDEVRREDLPDDLGGAGFPLVDLYREFASLEEGTRTFERYHAARALEREGGNRASAARRLGLTVKQLEAHLQRSSGDD